MLITKLKKLSICALMLTAFTLIAGCGSGSGGSASTTGQPVIAEAAKLIRSSTPIASDYQNAVQELYVAYFGRPADATGLVNFENALLAAHAPTDIQGLNAAYNTSPAIQSLLNNFGTSAESIALYGTGNTAAFVSAIYQNVLGRTPVAGDPGAAWWVNEITSGRLTQGNAALSIMAGALVNTTAQGILDGELINNRIAAASYFTAQLSYISGGAVVYSGNAAAAAARTMLSEVTATTTATAYQTSAVAAINSIGTFTCVGFPSSFVNGSTTPTGLSCVDSQPGAGAVLTAGHTPNLTFTGYLYNSANAGSGYEGTVIQPTYTGTLSPIGVGAFISGFDQGLLGMQVGGTRAS